jgi:hypothetical protein
LVPEILANFFCPSGKFVLEKMKKICVGISTILPLHDATKSARIYPMVIGCPFTSWWIVEKRSSSGDWLTLQPGWRGLVLSQYQ